jgi:hypothetical protein
MENLKPLSEVLQPDTRNSLFVGLDTGEPRKIDEHHAAIAAVVLEPQVPEDVRSYFATIQNVCLYAWFAYDLYAVVHFLCLTATEMALRKKLPYTGSGRDSRSLQNLIDEAVGKNLIREKAFSHVRMMRENLAHDLRLYRAMGRSSTSMPKSDYAAVLRRAIPSLRNSFAHPRGHSILMPGEALFQLRFTSEFINHLFAP